MLTKRIVATGLASAMPPLLLYPSPPPPPLLPILSFSSSFGSSSPSFSSSPSYSSSSSPFHPILSFSSSSFGSSPLFLLLLLLLILLGLLGRDLASLGIPSEEEMVSLYCQEMGLAEGIPDWNFYMAFSFFRVAAILQGVYKRSQMSECVWGVFGESKSNSFLSLPFLPPSLPPFPPSLSLSPSLSSSLDQASSDNAAAVGLLAEDFANKGWALAQQQSNSTGLGPLRGVSGSVSGMRKFSTVAGNSNSNHTHIGT